MQFKCIIIGGSGATGRQLLKKLIKNKNCIKITSIGRKKLENYSAETKLKHIVVDSLLNLSSTEQYWINQDVLFNCIGTTKQRAGGADEFYNIEFGISNEIARMGSASNINHASLISASGADHQKWAKKWIHPLFYIKTMGKKEQTIVSNFSFKYQTIFKPGMLIRMLNKTNFFEKCLEFFGFGLRVEDLALAMMKDAEKVSENKRSIKTKYFIGNNEIITSIKD